MLLVAAACLLLIALTTLLHYEVLRGINGWLPALRIPNRSKLLVVMFAAFTAHILEVGLYGAAVFALIRYAGLGSLTGGDGATLINCLYFSAETYSSLGFGDLIPTGPIRLLAGTEALNGLLLIGWSASFAYIAMERFWRIDSGESPS
ncbi:MAG: ion channel [Polaromonas sp.]